MKTPKADPRYPEAYYPYFDKEKHRYSPPPHPRAMKEALSRYSRNIYSLDKDPYYGSDKRYRVYNKPELNLLVVSIFLFSLFQQ